MGIFQAILYTNACNEKVSIFVAKTGIVGVDCHSTLLHSSLCK